MTRSHIAGTHGNQMTIARERLWLAPQGALTRHPRFI